jgi:LPXTG-motif cell wall-anchored protein
MERIGSDHCHYMNDVMGTVGPMTGIGEDNVLYFALGIAAGAALFWVLVRSIRTRL